MKKEVRSQAALEFLTTYAWAFLVIMITIGTLYYFGIFDFSKFLPQKCVFPSQFECIDFSFVGDEVRFRLVNNLGEDIDIKDLGVTNDAVDPLNCPIVALPSPAPTPAAPFLWKAGDEQDFAFTGCTAGVFIQKERTDAKISITFCAPATAGCPGTSDVDHTVNGKITAVVT